jgi:hypothetical protein
MVRRTVFVLLAVLLALTPTFGAPAYGQDPPTPDQVTPHLGYGIHWAPNTSVDPRLVDQLGMDWVKVYELGHASLFPNQRVLLRIDAGWQTDWPAFKQNFAAYIREVARQPVEAVEIHNEPNLSLEWGNRQPNAWQYTQLLRIAYTIIKSIKPSLIVVSGGLAPTITTPDRMAITDLDFAREMFANGAGQWFDAFGYHPYGYNLPPEAPPNGPQPLVFRRTELMRALMEEFGIYKQMWLTEFGWLRNPSEDGVNCSDTDPNFSGFAWMRVSADTQADYLARAFDYAHLNWPWAGPMFVWNLNFQQVTFLSPCSHMRWFGLLKGNGDPLPAFSRLARMKRYPSDYAPSFELRSPDRLYAEISLLCPQRASMGTFTIENVGYPAATDFSIEPLNLSPPYLEVQPTSAGIGESITVYADPSGLAQPGQYTVYLNVKTTYKGRPLSQGLRGVVNVWHLEQNCQ